MTRKSKYTLPRRVWFWGNDRMQSVIRLKITDRESGEEEIVALSSLMELRRGNPYKTEAGLSKLDVHVKFWRAIGFSKLMNKRIQYRLTDCEQPVGCMESQQVGADFPIRIVFKSKFDIFLGSQLVASGTYGEANARDVMTVPPRGTDHFEPNKEFEFGQFMAQSMTCTSSMVVPTLRQKLLYAMGDFFGMIPEPVRQGYNSDPYDYEEERELARA